MRRLALGLFGAWLTLAWAGAAQARVGETDATVGVAAARVDSSAAGRPSAVDSTAGGPARLRRESPRGQVYAGRPPKIWWVTVRSGLVPGWGQLANGKPLKAGLLVGLDAYWLYGVLSHESDRKSAVRAGDTAAANSAVDRRNFRIWMMGATAIYAMLDAYVDAHFYDYDEGWTGRIGLGPVGRPEVRLAYRF